MGFNSAFKGLISVYYMPTYAQIRGANLYYIATLICAYVGT